MSHVEIYPHHHITYKARLDLPGDYALLNLKEMIDLKNKLAVMIDAIVAANVTEAEIIKEAHHENGA